MVMLRIERARELLAHGMSLSDAAASAGFSDQSHMGRWFRRICGVTPATYARHTGSIAFQTRTGGADMVRP
jgi:AraC-like DNA-binding protein